MSVLNKTHCYISNGKPLSRKPKYFYRLQEINPAIQKFNIIIIADSMLWKLLVGLRNEYDFRVKITQENDLNSNWTHAYFSKWFPKG